MLHFEDGHYRPHNKDFMNSVTHSLGIMKLRGLYQERKIPLKKKTP